MSMIIRYSDRIDSLASDLKRQLLQEDGDPFVFRQVIVPNGNLAKWLQMRAFADEPSLCAGIDFPFLDRFLRGALVEALPEEEGAVHSKALPSVSGAIASVLMSDVSRELIPLRRYVDPEAAARDCDAGTEQAARKLWQLSAKLAELFSEYELRRPELIANWLGKAPRPDGKAPSAMEQAEAALYRAVYGPDGLLAQAAPSLRGLFEKVAATPPAGPARTFYFFGHSSLSPLHAEILHWLAQTHEVYYYHLTVCVEYWGDIAAPWERIKKADRSLFESKEDEGENLGIENELLDAWGRAGRATMKLMIDKEEAATADCPIELDALGSVADPVASDSVLSIAQASVRHRTSDLPRRKQDASIQVVACQGIRREVEMVYNAILGAVLDPSETGGSGKRPWGPCDFSDIAVLVPDMATYRPMIEAVFDARGQIPYGLIDATASQTSRFLQGALDLFRLAMNGLDRTTLFPVLENPCVQRALRFGPDQLRGWRTLVDQIGAFRSFDDADSKSRGLARATNFTWDHALSRLRLAAVGTPEEAGGVSLPVEPCGDGDAEQLRLSEIVERLYRRLVPLRDKRLPFAPMAEDGTPDHGWIDELVSLFDGFLAADPDDSLETGVRRDLLASVRSLSIVEGRHPLALLVQFIEQSVGAAACRRGGYLTSGVTIAALQPMRPVPFKQVFVLGLGEGFPGMVADSSLDLRGLEARLGDARMPDINRYLFLETFMATRDRLVLSYVSQDIKKDAELFPSSVVRDLLHFLEDHVLEPGEEGKRPAFRVAGLPLLESDSRCTGAIAWAADDWAAGILPTYHDKARIAERVREGREPPPADPFLSTAIREAGPSEALQEISLSTLASFMEKPLRTLLGKRFGVAVEGYQDSSIPDHEPLALVGGKPTWDFEGELFDRWLEPLTTPDEKAMEILYRNVINRFRETGRLPDGAFGAYEEERLLRGMRTKFDYGGLFLGAGLRDLAHVRPFAASVPVQVKIGGDTKTIILSGAYDHYFPAIAQGDGDDPGAAPVDTMAVFRKYKCEKQQPPPAAAIRPFLVWLAARACGEAAPSLRVTMFYADPGKDTVMSFLWQDVAPEEARAALESLAQDWIDYAASTDADGRLVDFDYRDLQKALARFPADGTGWGGLCEALADGGDDYRPSATDFNNDLVIQSVAEALGRPPVSKDEMKSIYKNRYELFCKGDREGN